jgi:4,5:9,10-diseco-3-hydroxy-5,9,17-trioxoandrosta-1(10),2-diene-4-oate hydrolase
VTRALAAAVGALVVGCRAAPVAPAERFPTNVGLAARSVTVDGTTLRYIDLGRGTPVVLLHDLGAAMYVWRKVVGPLAAAHYRVIAFDNRGFGASDKPAHGYDNAAYARLLVGLMDSLHLPDAVLVGHSMGGAIAAEVAIRFPERVRGLVLVGSAGLGTREPLVFRVARWPLIGPLVLAFRGRGLTERILKSSYANPALVTPADVDQYYAPVAEPAYGRSLRAVLREFRWDALEGRLDRIAAPTLLVWGVEDRWVPLAVGRLMASQIPRCALVPVWHAGHAVPEEAPGAFTQLVIGFLEQGLPRVPADLARRP